MINARRIAAAVMLTSLAVSTGYSHTESPSITREYYRASRPGWFNDFQESKGEPAAVTRSTRANGATQTWPPKKWSSISANDFDDKDYKGIIVEHGKYLGRPLFWKAKWWVTPKDIPGLMPDSGGTSGWKLLNSAAAGVQNPQMDFEECDQNASSEAQVCLPTWMDGAQGAYAIISDDVGAFENVDGYNEFIEFTDAVNDREKDFFNGYRPIRVAFGAQIDKADSDEYAWMRNAVKKGHEMLNHSYNHTSAAHQWLTFYQDDASGDTLKEIDDFTSAYGDTVPISGVLSGYDDPYVAHLAYINRLEENKAHVGKDLPKWVSGAIVLSPKGFDAISGTVERFGNYEIKNTADARYVKCNTKSWINKTEPHVLLVDCAVRMDDEQDPQSEFGEKYDGWKADEFELNVQKAGDTLDMNVYNVLRDAGELQSPYFEDTKKTEFYVYPYDAFDSSTHAYLEENGYIGSRGGSKGPDCTPFDFFHPFRTDFDAHYGDKYGVYSEGTNPHQYLTLKSMLDTIVSQHGFHTRETHTVTDRDDLGWGPVPVQDFKKHLEDLIGRIKENNITMYTPSEAVKYRITRDNMTVDISKVDDTKWAISPTITLEQKYHETYNDILVCYMMTLPSGTDVPEGETLIAKYEDGTFVRRQPWKHPTNNAWSVYGDPYKGEVIVSFGPGVSIEEKPTAQASSLKAAYRGILDGHVALTLPTGNYTADIFSPSGRLVRTVNFNAVTNEINRPLSTAGLARGMFLLNVHQGGTSILKTKLMLQ